MNRLNIFTLIGRLRRHLLLAGGVKTRLGKIIAQTKSAILGNLRESFAQLFVCKLAAFLEEFREVFKNAFRSPHIFRITIYGNVLTSHVNADVKKRFQILNVLVMNTE